ncbi:hypothetical protein PB2503_02077 [Parvularcula bermudensis HTCC2503]|uniref:Glycosyltransferase n=1 Tax=Parvularcula bermudensis (strain ATCC BAA-594 / HTCC2503 / KCTC 12087) TaxID=314260 RepID=E0TC61_PARBH|nr:hypothetical protein PB2503_02077 [Parvularcula bermudensis HTCC2503]
MAKPPLIGRVKTRLARDIGAVSAVGFYRWSVHRLLTRLARPRQWRLVLAVNERAARRYACWPAGTVERCAQGRGNLGDRIGHVCAQFGAAPCVVIGTDSPQIDPWLIERAFAALGGHDAVFGPAEDGGYWAIGVNHGAALPDLSAVRWSTPKALEDSLAAFRAQARIATLPTLVDVDDAASYRQLVQQYGPLRHGPMPPQAREAGRGLRGEKAAFSGRSKTNHRRSRRYR